MHTTIMVAPSPFNGTITRGEAYLSSQLITSSCGLDLTDSEISKLNHGCLQRAESLSWESLEYSTHTVYAWVNLDKNAMFIGVHRHRFGHKKLNDGFISDSKNPDFWKDLNKGRWVRVILFAGNEANAEKDKNARLSDHQNTEFELYNKFDTTESDHPINWWQSLFHRMALSDFEKVVADIYIRRMVNGESAADIVETYHYLKITVSAVDSICKQKPHAAYEQVIIGLGELKLAPKDARGRPMNKETVAIIKRIGVLSNAAFSGSKIANMLKVEFQLSGAPNKRNWINAIKSGKQYREISKVTVR